MNASSLTEEDKKDIYNALQYHKSWLIIIIDILIVGYIIGLKVKNLETGIFFTFVIFICLSYQIWCLLFIGMCIDEIKLRGKNPEAYDKRKHYESGLGIGGPSNFDSNNDYVC